MSDTHPQPERFVGGDYKILFTSIGLPYDKNIQQQFDLFMRAMRIFIEREESRGSLWAKYDEDDALSNMRTKFRRIEHYVESHQRFSSDSRPHAELMDDALDLLNYTAFLLRHVLGWKPDVA